RRAGFTEALETQFERLNTKRPNTFAKTPTPLVQSTSARSDRGRLCTLLPHSTHYPSPSPMFILPATACVCGAGSESVYLLRRSGRDLPERGPAPDAPFPTAELPRQVSPARRPLPCSP